MTKTRAANLTLTNRALLSVAASALAISCPLASFAQESHTRIETRSSSTTSVSGGGSSHSSTDSIDLGAATEKSMKFNPKFKERILNLKEQIQFALTKGFVTAEEAAAFNSRQDVLLHQEAELKKNGYPKPALDELEKAITLLNSDLHKASNKASSGAATGTPPAASKTTTTTTTTTAPAAKPASTSKAAASKTTVVKAKPAAVKKTVTVKKN